MPERPSRPRRLPRKSWTLQDVVRLQSLLLGRLADALRQPDLDTDQLVRIAHAVSQATNATRQAIVESEIEPRLAELERIARTNGHHHHTP